MTIEDSASLDAMQERPSNEFSSENGLQEIIHPLLSLWAGKQELKLEYTNEDAVSTLLAPNKAYLELAHDPKGHLIGTAYSSHGEAVEETSFDKVLLEEKLNNYVADFLEKHGGILLKEAGVSKNEIMEQFDKYINEKLGLS